MAEDSHAHNHPALRAEFRAVSARDIDDVVRVLSAAMRAADGAPPETRTLSDFRKRMEDDLGGGAHCDLALLDGAIVGFASFHTGRQVLDFLMVDPSLHGASLGRQLLDRVKEAMPEGFLLRTWAASRRAGAFYERERLQLMAQGLHPKRDIVMRVYGWNVGPDLDPSKLLRA